MKIIIFLIIFIWELITLTTIYMIAKIISDIYTYKKVNKKFEELMKASQDGIEDN